MKALNNLWVCLRGLRMDLWTCPNNGFQTMNKKCKTNTKYLQEGETEKRRKETHKRCNKHKKRKESTFTRVLYFMSPQNCFLRVPLVESDLSKILVLYPTMKTGSKLKNLWYLYFTRVFTFYMSFTTSQGQISYLCIYCSLQIRIFLPLSVLWKPCLPDGSFFL